MLKVIGEYSDVTDWDWDSWLGSGQVVGVSGSVTVDDKVLDFLKAYLGFTFATGRTEAEEIPEPGPEESRPEVGPEPGPALPIDPGTGGGDGGTGQGSGDAGTGGDSGESGQVADQLEFGYLHQWSWEKLLEQYERKARIAYPNQEELALIWRPLTERLESEGEPQDQTEA